MFNMIIEETRVWCAIRGKIQFSVTCWQKIYSFAFYNQNYCYSKKNRVTMKTKYTNGNGQSQIYLHFSIIFQINIFKIVLFIIVETL